MYSSAHTPGVTLPPSSTTRGERARQAGRGTSQHSTPTPPPSPTWAEVARGGSSRGEDQTCAQPPAEGSSTPYAPPTPTPTPAHPPSPRPVHTANTWHGCAAGGRAYLPDWCWRLMGKWRMCAFGFGLLLLLLVVILPQMSVPKRNTLARGDGNRPGRGGGGRRGKGRLKGIALSLTRHLLAWPR